MWPCNNYFLHCQSLKLCTRCFFSNCVWSQLKYQPSTILLVQNAAGELKDRKGRTRRSVSILVIIHSSIDCSYNFEHYVLFSIIWKLLEILWLFSGEQAKKIPDYEWTGSSDHCFRGHRISSLKELQTALLGMTTICKVQWSYSYEFHKVSKYM